MFYAGSDRAFEQLYHRYFPLLRNTALQKTGNAEVAADLCQETFLSFYHKPGVETGKLKAYLLTILKNKVFDHYRRTMVRDNYVNVLQREIRELETSAVSQKVEAKELEHQIYAAINQLPDQCRRVFRLSREVGLSNRQIALELNISLKTVEAHMTKALGLLKSKLDLYIYLGLLVGILTRIN